jgi:hypothetical protein
MEVVHTNLLRLYELIFDGRGWYIVKELVDGGDFLSHVRGETAAVPDGYQRRGLTTTESHVSKVSILPKPDLPGSAQAPKPLSSSGRKRLREALLQLARGDQGGSCRGQAAPRYQAVECAGDSRRSGRTPGLRPGDGAGHRSRNKNLGLIYRHLGHHCERCRAMRGQADAKRRRQIRPLLSLSQSHRKINRACPSGHAAFLRWSPEPFAPDDAMPKEAVSKGSRAVSSIGTETGLSPPNAGEVQRCS